MAGALSDFLNKIGSWPGVTFKNDMIILQRRGTRAEIDKFAEMLDRRGASYSVSADGSLLTFVIAPKNGGELDTI